ncbi:hypothetical protein [Methanosarcina acetivorans]|uniref:hypothetical protein n=1 Tax=Methanosarcina acetivorans TaxID=2214 RepID=UPI0012FED098|nr:hypothetical protein [Methanosarcina acetivorans]
MSSMEFLLTFPTRLNSMLLGQDYTSFGSTGFSGSASRVKKRAEGVIPKKKPEGTIISAMLLSEFVFFLGT